MSNHAPTPQKCRQPYITACLLAVGFTRVTCVRLYYTCTSVRLGIICFIKVLGIGKLSDIHLVIHESDFILILKRRLGHIRPTVFAQELYRARTVLLQAPHDSFMVPVPNLCCHDMSYVRNPHGNPYVPCSRPVQGLCGPCTGAVQGPHRTCTVLHGPGPELSSHKC